MRSDDETVMLGALRRVGARRTVRGVKVLVTEDEPRIRGLIEKGLRAEGFTVDAVADGREARDLATTQSYDVLVLDIMLPGLDGLAVLRHLRAKGINAPVLLVTARGELEQRVEGLELGADDYLPKPFHIEELVARVRALGRRAAGAQLNQLSAGDVSLNLATREVKRAGRAVELTTREFNLLELLLRAPGRVHTRAQILDHVWGYQFDPGTNVVDVYVRRVRAKLGDDAAELIETVRGVGYRFRRGAAP